MSRVLVTGTRTAARDADVRAHLDALRGITVVAHGACHLGGADETAGVWAAANGVIEWAFPVDHARDGPWPGAGPTRNRRMLGAVRPDLVLAFPVTESRGTFDCAQAARDLGFPTWVILPGGMGNRYFNSSFRDYEPISARIAER